MKKIQKHSAALSIMLAAMLTLTRSARSEESSPDKAQALALLEEVKKTEHERQVTAKQKDLDRLNEDLAKGQKESDTLQKSIDKMATAITESSGSLDQLTGQKKHLSQVIELNALRIDAEKLKLDGLKMLSDAQSKALAALAKHNELTELLASLGKAQMSQLTQKQLPEIAESTEKGEQPSASKQPSDIAEIKRKLVKCDRATSAADAVAREALQAASSKLQQSDVAAEKAKKRGVELGLEDASSPADDKEVVTPSPTPHAN